MRAPIRLLLLSLALAACGGEPARTEPTASAAPAAAAPGFSVYDLQSQWRDQDGNARALASLRGRVQVMAMVYTHCTHTCPQIVVELKQLEAALSPEERARTGFVLVSLDPERDTPAQLEAFATSLRLDPAAWTLLTGDADDVRELAAVLGIRYRGEADAQISHSNAYLVLDADGGIVHRQDGLGSGTAPVLARIRAAAAR
jgi:protein SCO1/2